MITHLTRILAAALAATALLVGGCSDDDESSSGGEVVVSAATSLKTAFTEYGQGFDAAEAQFSFAGSDELAAQIRQGVKPDVFASANTKLPDQLFEDGLVERPRTFAANRLVLAVPTGEDKVKTLADLADDGVTIAIGSKDVPVGSYTRTVLGRLPADQREGIMDNVRSEEPDVGGISAKLTQGAVDAGFLYITDVTAAGNRLRAVELPESLQPSVAYGVAIVKGAENPDVGRTFIQGLVRGEGLQAMRQAGFEPPPGARQ